MYLSDVWMVVLIHCVVLMFNMCRLFNVGCSMFIVWCLMLSPVFFSFGSARFVAWRGKWPEKGTGSCRRGRGRILSGTSRRYESKGDERDARILAGFISIHSALFSKELRFFFHYQILCLISAQFMPVMLLKNSNYTTLM